MTVLVTGAASIKGDLFRSIEDLCERVSQPQISRIHDDEAVCQAVFDPEGVSARRNGKDFLAVGPIGYDSHALGWNSSCHHPDAHACAQHDDPAIAI